MAKTPNNFASPPAPHQVNTAGDGFVEMDRFPPKRGNPKESRRTVFILGGAALALIVGVLLKPLFVKDQPAPSMASQRLLPPPPPDTRPGIEDSQIPISAGGSTRSNGKSAKASSNAYSPFDSAAPATGMVSASPSAGIMGGASGTGTGTSGVAITRPYNPFGASSPAPAAPTSGTGSAPVYGSADEPPVTPSLSRTGGVYRPSDFASPAPGMSGGRVNTANTTYLPNTSSPTIGSGTGSTGSNAGSGSPGDSTTTGAGNASGAPRTP